MKPPQADLRDDSGWNGALDLILSKHRYEESFLPVFQEHNKPLAQRADFGLEHLGALLESGNPEVVVDNVTSETTHNFHAGNLVMPAWPAYQIFLSREEGPEKSSLQTAREDFSSAKEIRANDTSTSISEFSKNIDYLDPPSAQKKGQKSQVQTGCVTHFSQLYSQTAEDAFQSP